MPDLLIRNIDHALKQQIERRARAHHRSLSQEAKLLIRRGLLEPAEKAATERFGLGTAIVESVRPEDRSDDLVFEVYGEVSTPPDFK
jgi:antitoxin FitA